MPASSMQQQSLSTILKNIYSRSYSNEALLQTLQFVANEIHQLHRQGVSLQDLGAEHIELRFTSFKDFNALVITSKTEQMPEPISSQFCAEQIAKIDLPDDYWRIFKYMYCNDGDVPESFNTIADAARQEFRQKTPRLFPEKAIWLWDEKSAQAMVVMDRTTKKKNRSFLQTLASIYRVLTTFPNIYWRYRRLIKVAFTKKRTLNNTFGVAIHPPYWQEEKSLLTELGNIPVLIRFYCHETREEWQQAICIIDELIADDRQVSIALVQDRKAVTDSNTWREFLSYVLPRVYEKVNLIEVGHAINRVKWGLWNSKDYRRLLGELEAYQVTYPNLKLSGPAVIDFEWHRVIDACRNLPKKIGLHALSQHLYVDRRGAPEEFQQQFSTLEKCAWIKSIAECSKNIDNRVVISEFNWPLKGTGIYSPIGSPYAAPGWFADNPGFSEDEYANYLIRYLAITLCSGFIDSAFSWRLSAHGYGLVDDLDGFRKRPAFYALKTMNNLIGSKTFLRKLQADANTYLLEFESETERVILAWKSMGEGMIVLPWTPDSVFDRNGNEIKERDDIMLTESPTYFIKRK